MTSGLVDFTACPFSLQYGIPSSPSRTDSGRVAGNSELLSVGASAGFGKTTGFYRECSGGSRAEV